MIVWRVCTKGPYYARHASRLRRRIRTECYTGTSIRRDSVRVRQPAGRTHGAIERGNPSDVRNR